MRYLLRHGSVEDTPINKNDGVPVTVRWSYWSEVEDWELALELIRSGRVEEVMEIDQNH